MPLLEQLDLIVDPSTRRVIPNPRSPDMPMVEVLMATSPNSMYAVRSRSPKHRQGGASHTRIPLYDMPSNTKLAVKQRDTGGM